MPYHARRELLLLPNWGVMTYKDPRRGDHKSGKTRERADRSVEVGDGGSKGLEKLGIRQNDARGMILIGVNFGKPSMYVSIIASENRPSPHPASSARPITSFRASGVRMKGIGVSRSVVFAGGVEPWLKFLDVIAELPGLCDDQRLKFDNVVDAI